MASDVLYDEFFVEESVDGGDNMFLSGGIMNTKELYLQDQTQCQDTSSSDSGISTVDDQQDVANITDLHNIFDTDFKELDLSLDYDFSTFVEDLFDPVKTEPWSPESCNQHDLIFHDDLTNTDEGMSMTQPVYEPDDPLSPASSANSPQNIYTIKISPKSASPQYDSSSPSHLLQTDDSFSSTPLDFTQIHNQSLNNLLPDLPSSRCSAASTTPGRIIILPSIKKENRIPILPSSRDMLIFSSGDVRTAPNAATVNIDSILNSKVKIQPKPGAEIVGAKGSTQWVSTNGQAQFSNYQPFTVKTSSSPTSDVGITSGTDDKYMKRAQRIIKNRESASLSRKKKKEYMTSLEVRLDQCRMENERLMKENESLKQVLTCLQHENSGLKFPNMSPAKKICLMCVTFLLVLNLSPFSFMNEKSSTSSPPGISPIHHVTGRHLMSLEDDIASRTFEFKNGTHSKKEQWPGTELMQFGEELSLLAQKLNITDKLGNMCPMYFNSTESNRLAEQLRTWMISHEKEKKKTERKQQKKKKDYPSLRRFTGPGPGFSDDQKKQSAPGSEINRPTVTERNYPVQVFNWGYDPRHRLLHTIPRRNDTFYVLSFSTDYFLVPATAHNKTMRPRMSLLMPVVTPSVNESTSQPHDSIGMMQIDCEILSTNIINIHRSAFPDSTHHNSSSHQRHADNSTSTRDNRINLHSIKDTNNKSEKIQDHIGKN